MSLKQEIETWVQALSFYDNNEFEESLRIFDGIADQSRILFNLGVIHATIGEHEKAVQCYIRATQLDQYLAVAYFQQGVSNFLVGDFEEALANFNDTLLYLRGNTYIDYDQLGLKFKLYSCEVLFNRGLCYIYLQQEKPGMQDFYYAVKEKMTPDHSVIDDAIRERAQGYTVFSIPVGVLYRPNEAKVKNLKTKDYLGKARLIATATTSTSTGFAGAEQKEQRILEATAKDDRLPENISYAATNLVQRNLTSRRGPAREQSAPPTMNRNMFPPTPPPEVEKPNRVTPSPNPYMNTNNNSYMNVPHRSSSQRQNGSRSNVASPPPVLEQQPNMNFRSSHNEYTPPMSSDLNQQWQPRTPEVPRLGTTRTASEPRGPPSRRLFTERGSSTRAPPPAPLFRETTPAIVATSLMPAATIDSSGMVPQSSQLQPVEASVEDVYNMYSRKYKSHRKPSRSQRAQDYLDEEDEYINSSPDELSQNPSPPRPVGRSASRGPSVSSIPKTEMRKIRVKVHANEDTRYIMVNQPFIEYEEFESKIREKFNIKGKLKIRMRDLDDDPDQMILMADQDDLEVLINHVKSVSRKERNEMGKMEVWIQEL